MLPPAAIKVKPPRDSARLLAFGRGRQGIARLATAGSHRVRWRTMCVWRCALALLLPLLVSLVAASPAGADEPPSVLDRSVLALGMGAELHDQSPIPLDWTVGGETRLSPLFGAELDAFITNGSRWRNRIDFISGVAAVAVHPLARLATDRSPFFAAVLVGTALDLGLSLEMTHVGPTFQSQPGLSLGLRVDLPLTRDGRLAARLELRRFFAHAVVFPGAVGGFESYGPPALETFAGLAFTL